MDIETRLTNVEEDVEKLKTQCAVARVEHVNRGSLQEVESGLKLELHKLEVKVKDELHEVEIKLTDALHAVKVELKDDIHALEVRVEKALHAQTWALLGGVFAMLTATVTIIYYMTS